MASKKVALIDDSVNRYRRGLRLALKWAKPSKNPGDTGYAAEVARTISQRLKPLGLDLPVQYVRAWTAPGSTKVEKGGLSLSVLIRLGLGLKFSKDPLLAGAMISLILYGAWDPNKVPPEEVEALLRAGMKAATPKPKEEEPIKAQLEKIADGVNYLVLSTREGTMTEPHPLTKMIRGLLPNKNAEDVEAEARKHLKPESVARLKALWSGDALIEIDDWAEVAYITNKLSGKTFTVKDFERLTATAISSLPVASTVG